MTTALPTRTPQATGHAPRAYLTVLDPATGQRVPHRTDRGRAEHRAQFLAGVARLIEIRKAARL